MTGEQKPFNLELEALLVTPAGEELVRLIERYGLTVGGLQREPYASKSALREREIRDHEIATAYWNLIGTLGYTSRGHLNGNNPVPRHLYLIDILTYLGRE